MRFSARLIGGMLLLGFGSSLAAQQLTDAQRSAIKSACRSDYQKVCASVPPGTKDSLQCLVQHSQQVSAGCQQALAPAAASATSASSSSAPGAPAAAAAASAPAAATTPAAPAGQSMSPRQEAQVLRSHCSADFQKLCSGVQLGGGRAAACLRAHEAELTPGCRSALTSAAPH